MIALVTSVMEWHTKTIAKYKNEIISSAYAVLMFAVVFTLWSVFSGSHFQWQEIDPISFPDIFHYRFYSALAFIIPGAWLFHKLKFWQFLYRTSHDWRTFQRDKRDVWKILVGLTFLIALLLVSLLNSVISFLFNIWNLILYLLPPLGISLLLAFLFILLRKQCKQS